MNLTIHILNNIVKNKELISVKKGDYYYLLTPDKEKVILAVTPEGIYIENTVSQEHLKKALELLEDTESYIIKHKFDGEVIINEYIFHGKVICKEKTNGLIVEYLIQIDGKEYKVIVDIEELLNGEVKSAIKFNSNYTEEEKSQVLSKVIKCHTNYSLLNSKMLINE